MTGNKGGSGKEEQAGNVEQLTDEKLDKVSGGMHVCVICPPRKKPTGIEDEPGGSRCASRSWRGRRRGPACRGVTEGGEGSSGAEGAKIPG